MGIRELDIDEFEISLDQMRLGQEEKKKLVDNFTDLVAAQASAELKIQDETYLNSIPLLLEETPELRKQRIEDIVKMTGEGVRAFYDTIVKIENREIAQRILGDKTHQADLNLILEASAITAANPRQVPAETVSEMERLLKKKSRDFGGSRIQILLTATAVAGAMSQVGPLLGAALIGPGVAHAGSVIGGVFSSLGAGIKTGAIYLGGHPLVASLTGLSAGVAGLSAYAVARDTYFRKANVEARKAATETREQQLKAAETALAASEEMRKVTLASNALNKVMVEYSNKIEGKGGIINPSINAVLGLASSVREARRLAGEGMSKAFDSAVPYLPSAYDLFKGDPKELDKAVYAAFVTAPYNAALFAGSAVLAGGAAGIAVVGALGASAYNAVSDPEIQRRLSEMSQRISHDLTETAKYVNKKGQAALADLSRKAQEGFAELSKTLYGPGDRIERLNKFSESIGKDLNDFAKKVSDGVYDAGVAGISVIKGPGDRLERLANLGTYIKDGCHTVGELCVSRASQNISAMQHELDVIYQTVSHKLGEMSKYVNKHGQAALADLSRKAQEGFAELGKTLYGPGDRIERLNRFSQNIGKNLDEFAQQVRQGTYDAGLSAVLTIKGPGDRLERLANLGTYIKDSCASLGKELDEQLRKGVHQAGLDKKVVAMSPELYEKFKAVQQEHREGKTTLKSVAKSVINTGEPTDSSEAKNDRKKKRVIDAFKAKTPKEPKSDERSPLIPRPGGRSDE